MINLEQLIYDKFDTYTTGGKIKFNELTKHIRNIKTTAPVEQYISVGELSIQIDLPKRVITAMLSGDQEALYDIILHNLECLLDEEYVKKNNLVCTLTDRSFLTCLHRVLCVKGIDYQRVRLLNEVLYHYKTEGEDQEVYNLLYIISKMINNYKIAILTSYGIDDYTATEIVVGRYSSKKGLACIKRMNNAIANGNEEIMTIEMIGKIYSQLCDRPIDLLEGTMFDIEYLNHNREKSYLDIMSLTSVVVLDIVETLTSSDLSRLLSQYYNDIMYSSIPLKPRFNLDCLSVYDYPRIMGTIDMIRKRGQFVY